MPYADRVTHLTAGGGLNGTTVRSAVTVSNDGVKDMLTGGAGSDWLVVSPDDAPVRKDPEQALTI